VGKYGTDRQPTEDNTIRRMHFSYWVIKTTYTHSEYVILIAFPLHQWLRESASLLRFYLPYLSCTGVLISPLPDQDGNKLMFLSEWREFPGRLALQGKKTR